jgi:hypothetical protein
MRSPIERAHIRMAIAVRAVPGKPLQTIEAHSKGFPSAALCEQGSLMQASSLALQLQRRGHDRKSLIQRPKRKFGQSC